MPYTNIIARSSSNPPAMVADDVSALIPEDVSKEIIKGMTYKSAAMQLFRHRTMSRKQQRLPVVSALPTAYWVNGDAGLKQTTEVDWTNKYLNAEELAVLIPIPESVLDDVDYDLWTEIKPLIEEAIAVAIDDAIFFGNGTPASWPTAIAPQAYTVGNYAVKGAGVDVAADLNNAMNKCETEGYEINGFVIRPQLKGTLRGLRSTTNELIYNSSAPSNDTGVAKGTFVGTIWGEKAYVSAGGFGAFTTSADHTHYEAVCGDWSQGIIAVRQDITYKMFDQAVLQDNTGAIIFNLAQQDMVAMRVVTRVAFQVPNPPNRLAPIEANRYPFAVVTQGA